MSANGVFGGWANECGVELFTIGWIRCDKGGQRGPAWEEKPKRTIDKYIQRFGSMEAYERFFEKSFIKDIEEQKMDVAGTEVKFDDKILAPEYLPEYDIPLSSIEDKTERQIAGYLRAKELMEIIKIREQYLLSVKMLEEELYFMVLALDDDDF